MPWYLHLFWGAVVYLAACRLAQGLSVAGEWIAKSILRHDETLLALQREARTHDARRRLP